MVDLLLAPMSELRPLVSLPTWPPPSRVLHGCFGSVILQQFDSSGRRLIEDVFQDYRLEHKWSAVGFCSGAIAGLVAITPASGFVGSPAAVVFGVVAGTGCNFATQLKFLFGYDDVLDVSTLQLSSSRFCR
jgi:hypothetical protein